MNGKIIGMIVIVLVVIGFAITFGGWNKNTYEEIANTETAQEETTQETAEQPKEETTAPKQQETTKTQPVDDGTYTLAEIALHGSVDSCWSAVDGVVYDLTEWISEHPGGANNILIICGKDGSAAFAGQHGGSAQIRNLLTTFAIGTLAQ